MHKQLEFLHPLNELTPLLLWNDLLYPCWFSLLWTLPFLISTCFSFLSVRVFKVYLFSFFSIESIDHIWNEFLIYKRVFLLLFGFWSILTNLSCLTGSNSTLAKEIVSTDLLSLAFIVTRGKKITWLGSKLENKSISRIESPFSHNPMAATQLTKVLERGKLFSHRKVF